MHNWAEVMGIDASYNSTLFTGNMTKRNGVCPTGWHVPSDAEWNTLIAAVGGTTTAGTALKSIPDWSAGDDSYGFGALPGGVGLEDGSFGDLGTFAYFWTADQYEEYGAYYKQFEDRKQSVTRFGNIKATRNSLRCVRD